MKPTPMKPRIIMAQVDGSGTALVMTDRDVAPTAPLVLSPLISAEKYAGVFARSEQKSCSDTAAFRFETLFSNYARRTRTCRCGDSCDDKQPTVRRLVLP